jgi:hypothetical protein
MKLYNIYQNVILEEIFNKVELFEAVPIDDIEKILAGDNGKFYHVSFDYTDDNGNTSNRFVQIHQRNISTKKPTPNNLIDAYQISRDGMESGANPRTGNIESFEGWKKFNLDKMSNFKVSKIPFYQPKPKFNRTDNNSPTVASTPTIAQFDYQYSPSSVKKMEKTKQTLFPNVDTKVPASRPQVGPEPATRPAAQPTANPVVRPMRRIQPKPEEPIVEPEEEPIVEPEDEENNLELNK